MFGTVRSGIFRSWRSRAAIGGRASTCGAYFRAASKSILRDERAAPVAAVGEQTSRGWRSSRRRRRGEPAPCGRAFLAGADPVHLEEGLRFASTTSSIGLLANEDSPITTPRAAVTARATATSPSGCTACTPVGLIMTGIDMCWPMTVTAMSRSLLSPATCGAKPSSAKALVLSSRSARVRSRPRAPRTRPWAGASRPPLRLGHRLEPRVRHAGTPCRPGPAGGRRALRPVALSAMLSGAVRPPPHPEASECPGTALGRGVEARECTAGPCVAFITGAARGQGRAHAVRLASEGRTSSPSTSPTLPGVPYDSATPDDLADTARAVEALDRRVLTHQGDVRDFDGMKAFVDRGVAELGRLDIVVANAICIPATWDETTPRCSRTRWTSTSPASGTPSWPAPRTSSPGARVGRSC